MTDQQIEIWRKEAENYIESLPRSLNDWTVDDVIKAYIEAKRSQPVIELPNSDLIVFDSRSQERGFDSAIEYVSEILQELGYQYKVKE